MKVVGDPILKGRHFEKMVYLKSSNKLVVAEEYPQEISSGEAEITSGRDSVPNRLLRLYEIDQIGTTASKNQGINKHIEEILITDSHCACLVASCNCDKDQNNDGQPSEFIASQ